MCGWKPLMAGSSQTWKDGCAILSSGSSWVTLDDSVCCSGLRLFRDTGWETDLLSQVWASDSLLSSHEMQPMPSGWQSRVVTGKCLCCTLDLQSPFSEFLLSSVPQLKKLKPTEAMTDWPWSAGKLVAKLMRSVWVTSYSSIASLDDVVYPSLVSFQI